MSERKGGSEVCRKVEEDRVPALMSYCPSIPAVLEAEADREEIVCSQETRGARERAEREREEEERHGRTSEEDLAG